MADKKYHWFLLCFSIPQPGGMVYQSVFTNAPTKNVTLPRLMVARDANKIPSHACLMQVSYLGNMTKEEMNPSPEPVPVMAPTDPFMEGMKVGLTTEEPVNPYSAEPGKAMTVEAVDWFNGFNLARSHVTSR